MSPHRVNTFGFNVKAHVMQYTGSKPEATAFIENNLLVDHIISHGDGPDLKVKYESEAGDRLIILHPGMYIVVVFDRVLALAEDRFAKFMSVCA